LPINIVLQVIEAYADANKTFDELRKVVRKEHEFDPLRNFAEACRTELRALRV
jgi:hypothetical protein